METCDHIRSRLWAPPPRGPLSNWVLARQRGLEMPSPVVEAGAGGSDDLQLALYLAYEPHFSSLPWAPGLTEWDPAVIAFRSSLERVFEDFLRDVVPPIERRGHVGDIVRGAIAADDGPSLSRHMEGHGTLDDMRDVVVHRSLYQLKEGDAHTVGIVHLGGRPKQLLAAIQAGEYGADAPDREMHSSLFAATMRELGVDDRLHAHLGRVPASAFMISNLVSMFGLNRRWRSALVGHLTVFEMTSVVPMGRYARGLRRMGAPPAARRFYEVHTLADAEHELLALEMLTALVEDDPASRADALFGVQAVLATEALFARTLLECFARRAEAVGPPAA